MNAAPSSTLKPSRGTAAPEPLTRLNTGLLAPLTLTSFVGLLNGFALGPFLPAISADIGTSVPVLGQVATATFLITAIGGLVVGPLADRLGHRRMILAGLVTTLLSAAGTALAPGFGVLLITRMIGGIGGSVSSGVPLAVAGSRFAGDARRRALSIITATVAAGAVVGAPLLTSIGAALSWRAAFGFVAFLTALALLGFGLFFPREAPREDATGSLLRGLVEAYLPLIAERRMVLLFGAALLQAIAWTGPFTYLGAFFEDQLGFTTQEIGYGYMATGAGFFAGSVLGGGRMRGVPLATIFALSTALIGVLWAAILIADAGPYLTVGMLVCLTVVGGIGRVAFTTLLANVSPAGAATTMVLNASTITLGAALGSLLGGSLIGLGGYRLLGVGLPVFAFSAALVLTLGHARNTPARE